MGKWILPDGRTTDYICRECTSTQCNPCRIRELEAQLAEIAKLCNKSKCTAIPSSGDNDEMKMVYVVKRDELQAILDNPEAQQQTNYCKHTQRIGERCTECGGEAHV